MKKLFLYISIGITLLAIPITVFLAGRNREIRARAAPASTLSFSPASQSVKAGEKFTLDVKIDTATNQVGLVQLRIVYDPAYLEAEEITNGPLAPSIRASKKIDPNGKVSISVGAKDSTHPITGTGTIAILSMKTIKASATPVSIKFTPSPDTAGNGIGEGENDVIIGRSPAAITILNADGTPASADSSNLQTASDSAALTLAAIPTPTFAATNSASASPSALAITVPETEQGTTAQIPTIHGTGVPGSTITLTIHSEPRTVVVTVDANGNWVYTPETPLEEGPHTITALVTDPTTGATQTTTATFVVAAAEGIGGSSSGSAIPVSGSAHTTILLLTVGVLLLISGALIPLVLL